MDTHDHWYLMKHDDATVFGPVSFAQLHEWAGAAQISPLDKISEDETTWIKAPMWPELEMDWLLQVSEDHYYGPTTLPAMREFIKMGDIDEDTVVINCKDGTEKRVSDLSFATEAAENAFAHPEESEMERLNKRVARLEEVFIENRKLIRSMEAQLQSLVEHTGMPTGI